MNRSKTQTRNRSISSSTEQSLTTRACTCILFKAELFFDWSQSRCGRARTYIVIRILGSCRHFHWIMNGYVFIKTLSRGNFPVSVLQINTCFIVHAILSVIKVLRLLFFPSVRTSFFVREDSCHLSYIIQRIIKTYYSVRITIFLYMFREEFFGVKWIAKA